MKRQRPLILWVFIFMEIWKKIKDYPDYEISNLGRVKSLKFGKERVLKQNKNKKGYFFVCLHGTQKKTIRVHQLVAVAFLNHKINGMSLVVNHKNFIRTDNRVENLEIVTVRINNNKKHILNSSKYVGVCFDKKNKKWRARITINYKLLHLGLFENEIEAYIAYQEKLKTIKNLNYYENTI